ncbi:MAG: hypothetical protein NTZ97_02960 [Candidatus Moranbacteria bacterium]|nr:hypothetical protein [Candidatus Moranbacteria bacterium]
MKYFKDIVVAEKFILGNHHKGENIRIRVGLRTNGDLHLGNIFPIISALIIGKNLIVKGLQVELVVVLVDQEINKNKVIYNLSKADIYIKNIKKFILELNLGEKLKIKYKTISQVQKTQEFNKVFSKIVLASDKSLVIGAICKKCKSIIKHCRKEKSFFECECEKCKYKNIFNINKSGKNLLLEHDLLGAIENVLLDINLHILGSDHLIKRNKKTALEKREEYLKRLNYESKYITLLTPLVLFKGKKMSKSGNIGIFLKQIQNYYGKRYIENLVSFVKKNKKEKINLKSIKEIIQV